MRGWRSQNLSYDRLPTWRHGRGWFGAIAMEWHLLHDPHLRSASIFRYGFSLWVPFFGLHLKVGHKGGGEWQVSWIDDFLLLSHPWVREMEYRSSDPWWKKSIDLHVVDWLIGRTRCETTKGEPREVYIPMPEGSYRAAATPETRIWTRRWYWPKRRRDSWWLDIHGCIPRSGKGENSWDCGDDGLCGCGGDTLEGAIAHAVETSLRDRKRYGHDSKGTGREPALVLNGGTHAH